MNIFQFFIFIFVENWKTASVVEELSFYESILNSELGS